jgi:hypothetical protein
VKSPATQCPRCEAPAPFRPQRRPIGDKLIEVYIRCKRCNYEQILRVSTVDIERLIKQRMHWEASIRYTRARYGVPNSLAMAQVRKIGRQLRELEHEIAE